MTVRDLLLLLNATLNVEIIGDKSIYTKTIASGSPWKLFASKQDYLDCRVANIGVVDNTVLIYCANNYDIDGISLV